MSEHSILQRLLNAQTALRATLQKILDLNRQLKSLTVSKQAPENKSIKQELKLLNKVADQQAKIVQLYETNLRKVSNQ
jgi:hypothetical protein